VDLGLGSNVSSLSLQLAMQQQKTMISSKKEPSRFNVPPDLLLYQKGKLYVTQHLDQLPWPCSIYSNMASLEFHHHILIDQSSDSDASGLSPLLFWEYNKPLSVPSSSIP
jgi:hypothetical protein